MNRQVENQESCNPPSAFLTLTALLGAIVGNAMTIALLLRVLLNLPALYRAEMRSLEIVTASLQTSVELSVLLAAWVPIVICIVAFAIVIGGVAIIIWTNWVQQALAAINSLNRLCPTLPWWQRPLCYAWLAAVIGGLTMALGLFFTAAAVVMINILIIVGLG